MNIVFHGGIGFTNKSHAHIQRNIALGLVELGHEVTVCKIEDANFADSSNPDHNTFKSLCVPEHVYSDYNIWKTGHLEEFKVGGHKFDCLVHNNGNFVLREDIYNQFMALPFTHYIRSGMDAAKTIHDQIKKPVYGFFDSPVDEKIFHFGYNPYDYGVDGKFVFLSIAQGTWGESYLRRGINIGVKAFMEEFKEEDESVVLVLKIGSEVKQTMDLIGDRKNIKFIPGNYKQSQLAPLYANADCMLHPIMGSMWEAAGMEAMACGTPIIATDAGGPATYVRDRMDGWLIKYNWASYDKGDRKEMCFPGEAWKVPDMADLKATMRYVYETRGLHRTFGRKASHNVLQNFNRRSMAQKLVEFFDGSEEFVVR